MDGIIILLTSKLHFQAVQKILAYRHLFLFCTVPCFNRLPNNKILDGIKVKVFTQANSNIAQTMDRVENIVEKGRKCLCCNVFNLSVYKFQF